MRAVFFGSPAFAVPCLEALTEMAEVVAVYSQPDRPAGRGMKLRLPAVKARAQELGLPVRQPTKLRDGKVAAQLVRGQIDVAVVVAYVSHLASGHLDRAAQGMRQHPRFAFTAVAGCGSDPMGHRQRRFRNGREPHGAR